MKLNWCKRMVCCNHLVLNGLCVIVCLPSKTNVVSQLLILNFVTVVCFLLRGMSQRNWMSEIEVHWILAISLWQTYILLGRLKLERKSYLPMMLALRRVDVKWASCWDTYLLMTDDQIHWFSIVNSLMIALSYLGWWPWLCSALRIEISLGTASLTLKKKPKRRRDGSLFMEMCSALL